MRATKTTGLATTSARLARGGRAILAAALLASAARTSPARAEPPTDMASQAAARYEEGMTAARAERWPEAYAAFRAAWEIKQHPQIAANLGRAALKAGHPREAAERLSDFLREGRDISKEDRARGEELLAEARKQIGALTLGVNRPGAKLFLDGVAVEPAPGGEVFVDPGPHTVEARAPGAPAVRTEVEVKAGSTQHVGLWLLEAPAPAPAVPERSRTTLREHLIGAGIAGTIVAVGAGTALAVGSQMKAGDRNADPEGWARHEGERVALANASFWCFLAAGALGAGTLGAVLLAPRTGSDVGLRLEARGPGVVVRGSW